MVQVSSSNLTLAANATYPLNNVYIEKGCSAKVVGASTIELNQRGVYMVSCNGFATPAAATLVSTQMIQNGVARPDAISGFTGVAATQDTFGFMTLVRVADNNTNCCCTAPTTLQFVNGATAVTGANINVVVTKIC